MDWSAETLEGRFVRLEPLRPEHADGLWEASRDDETWRWLSIRRPPTRVEWDGWMHEALGTSDLVFATVELACGAPLGSTRFMALRPEHRSVEIGWTWLHPRAWRTGVNVDAKLLMLGHAFESWDCRRVEFKTDASNERSRGALEALGARFEGIHRKHMLVRDGQNRDTAWYAVTDDDWPSVRDALTRRVDALRDAGTTSP